MNITIVGFRAFDKPMQKVFIEKTFAEMHAELNTACNSYIPTSIEAGRVIDLSFIELCNLTDLQKNDAEHSKSGR